MDEGLVVYEKHFAVAGRGQRLQNFARKGIGYPSEHLILPHGLFRLGKAPSPML